MNEVEEIRARIPIEDLVSDYVQLKKAGRNFKGLCPFHNDRNPSFMVSPEKGIAWCFVCQKGGDIFSFFQLIEGIEFSEAIKLLAERAGVEIKNTTINKESKSKKELVQKALESANLFYKEAFSENKEAQQYWAKRYIALEISKLFEIGFAPDSFNKTLNFLKKDFSSDVLLESGLIIKRDQEESYFDRFRGRLMIPIKNHMGKIVGFGGRTIKDSKNEAKYINSPETIVYNKSYVLFGLDKTKEAIKEKDSVIILEGYLDLISSYQAGVKNVAAVSGVALTVEQLKLIKRYTKNLKLCFDQDVAGKEATKRSIELAAEQDFNIEIIYLKEVKDPDELIKKDPSLWEKAVEESISPVDFFFYEAEKEFDLNDLKEQKLFVSEVLTVLNFFNNPVSQNFYLKKLSEKCQIDFKYLKEELGKNEKKEKTEEITYKIKNLSSPQYLLGILSLYPNLILKIKESLIFKIFSDSETKDIYKKIMEDYNNSDLTENLLSNLLSSEDLEKLAVWQLFVEEKNDFFNKEEWEKEFEKVLQKINKENLIQAKKNIVWQMKVEGITPDERKKLALKIIEINKLDEMI